MIVYVETNFVLELALLQEQADSCEQILRLAENGYVRLVLPAFSLAEPFGTMDRRKSARNQASENLKPPLRELERTAPYRPHVDVIKPTLDLLLSRSAYDERDRLDETWERIARIAEVVPLDSDILIAAAMLRDRFTLSPQDAVVYASIRSHLQREHPARCCFLNRNAHDFTRPDIAADLRSFRCKLLPHFDQGYGYILSAR